MPEPTDTLADLGLLCRRCDVPAKYCPCEHPDVDLLAALAAIEDEED